ncbi:unnamed protein product [Owenia fusiformis]|uniref:Uncharacterized protein n=1 Tax=Owenia fusiformis TaxID=6347 RepID=A0A8J1TMD6_OWEFU|nr:unnamed protein product [Owenia fusiformis]
MTTATATSAIDPLIDSVTCSICLEVLDDPRSLPCMHSYCRKCIQSTMDKHQHKNDFPCPNCRDLCPIPDQGAAGLKVNFFANSVLDAVKDRSAASRDALNCDICLQVDEHVPAILKCLECNEKLCKSCGRAHKLSRFTKSHQVLVLSGDSSRDAKTAIDMLSQRTLYCEVHTKEPLKYFCQKDQRLICQDCFAFKHQGHPLEDIEQTAKANLKNLSAVIDLGRQRSAKYEVGIQAGHIRKQMIERKKQVTKSRIATDRKIEIDKVNARFNKMEIDTIAAASSATKSIVVHLAEFQFNKNAIDGTVKQLEALQDHGHPADIVNMIPEMNSKCNLWSIPPEVDFEVSVDNDPLATHVKEEYVQKHQVVEEFLDICILPNDDIVKIDDGKADIYDDELKPKCTINFPKITGAWNKVKGDCFATCNGGTRLISICIYNLKNGKLKRKVFLQSPINNLHDFAMNHLLEFVILTKDFTIFRVDYNGKLLSQATVDGNLDTFRGGSSNMVVNSKNRIIMSYNGGIAGIELHGSSAVMLFWHKPTDISIYHMRPCVDDKDNIIVINNDKNTVELLTPDGIYIKDLIEADTTDCKVDFAEPNSKGELILGANHEGTRQMCIFTLKYRGQDGSFL